MGDIVAPRNDTIAFIFDFDDTLAPDCVSGSLEDQGIDSDEFWEERVQPLVDKEMWDPIPAAFYRILQESNRRPPERRFTRESLAEYGRSLDHFDGVEELFERIRSNIHDLHEDAEVEFYCISCGIGEIVRNAPIAEEFDQIWACEFAYDEDGAVEFVRRLVSHTEKTRYIYQVAMSDEKDDNVGRPFAAGRSLDQERIRVPLKQIVYVGDGFTDVPCFSLLDSEEGIPIGVYKERTKKKWGEKSAKVSNVDISNLANVDYTDGSELSQSLILAGEAIVKRMKLRALAHDSDGRW